MTTLDLTSTLWAWTQHSLQNHLYENAIFLAERLVAESPSEPSKLMLATCYYSQGAPARAQMVLSGCSAPQNRYLLALCHMHLGKLVDAQNVLLGNKHRVRLRDKITPGYAKMRVHLTVRPSRAF